MTRAIAVVCIIPIILWQSSSVCPAREWTTRDGRRVEADLVGVQGDKVAIKRKSDGRVFEVPLDRLSDKDQAFVKAHHISASDVSQNKPLPCELTVPDVKVEQGQALVKLDLKWNQPVVSLSKEEVTIVVLFQRELIVPLRPDLLALSRSYLFGFASDDFLRIVSGLTVKHEKGESEAALLLFFVNAKDGKVDLRKSGTYVIPIRIERANRTIGQPAVFGEGVLSFAVFKQDDPKLDHMKSTKYKPLSNVVSTAVKLGE